MHPRDYLSTKKVTASQRSCRSTPSHGESKIDISIGGILLLMTNSARLALVIGAGLILVALSATAADKPLFLDDEQRPSDAVVLFDGKDLSQWVQVGSDKPAGWKVAKGYMEVGGGNIRTKQEFMDCQLHIEFWLPSMPDAKGQARANSGVYLQGRYEVQVLDSYGLRSQSNDCGAIYGVAAPLVNACRPPEHWQSYDILFHAPKFDDTGNLVTKPRITVLQNGVLIQENVDVFGTTTAGAPGDPKTAGPVMLQDHGNPVRYRNVWVRPLREI